jgi:hypothetical protein
MVLRWLVQKVSKMEEFLYQLSEQIDYALAEAHTTMVEWVSGVDHER